MSYRKEIKIFRIESEISLPIKSNPEKVAHCGIGDLLVCYDGENVYARDYSETENDSFVLLLYGLNFLDINPSIFKCISH